MNIGLYFGSFNPVHVGHLIIASHVANTTEVSQVWFVVSPHNPLKSSGTLLNEYHRLHLVQLAIEGDNQLRACDVEFKLPKPSYTIDTLTYLKEKFPSNQFSVILGSDSFKNLPKWKNFENMISNNKFYVYERPRHKVEETWDASVEILEAPLLDIAATTIRKKISDGQPIRYLVPEKVREEIERNGYYKNCL